MPVPRCPRRQPLTCDGLDRPASTGICGLGALNPEVVEGLSPGESSGRASGSREQRLPGAGVPVELGHLEQVLGLLPVLGHDQGVRAGEHEAPQEEQGLGDRGDPDLPALEDDDADGVAVVVLVLDLLYELPLRPGEAVVRMELLELRVFVFDRQPAQPWPQMQTLL